MQFGDGEGQCRIEGAKEAGDFDGLAERFGLRVTLDDSGRNGQSRDWGRRQHSKSRP